MSDKLKTLIVVTLISLLIWTYAESQSIQTRPFPAVRMLIPAPSSTEAGARVVWRTGDGERVFRVDLEIEGSAVSIDRVRTDLDEAIDLTASAAFPSESGGYTLRLDELLQKHPIFRDSGLSFVVDPPTVQVEVDTIERVSLPIMAPEVTGVEIRPLVPTAELALPASVWAEVRDQITELRLRTDQIDVTTLERGIRTIVPAVLIQRPTQVIDAPFVEISPGAVDVRATLIVPRKSHVISTVRFFLVLPTDQAGKWNVGIKAGDDDFLRDVKVSGPSEIIDQLMDPNSGVALRAYVELTQDQLDQRATSGIATFSLTNSELTFEMGGNEVGQVEVQLTISPVQAVPDESGGTGDAGGPPSVDGPGSALRDGAGGG
jgi:hypothetical protein